jgi:general secretion pathway protein G
MAINVQSHARKGFSLMEMMVVIAIIGIIGGMLVPGINKAYKSVQRSTAVSTMRQFKTGITRYQMNIGQLPIKLQDLIKKPKDERASKKWDGPYIGEEDIQAVPEDPWGGKFEYKVTQGGKHPYELFSYGPDGKGSKKEEWINVWDEK